MGGGGVEVCENNGYLGASVPTHLNMVSEKYSKTETSGNTEKWRKFTVSILPTVHFVLTYLLTCSKSIFIASFPESRIS